MTKDQSQNDVPPPDDGLPLIAHKLREWREAAGIPTQAEAARRLGINPSQVWKWENGRVGELEGSSIDAISEVYHVSANTIRAAIRGDAVSSDTGRRRSTPPRGHVPRSTPPRGQEGSSAYGLEDDSSERMVLVDWWLGSHHVDLDGLTPSERLAKLKEILILTKTARTEEEADWQISTIAKGESKTRRSNGHPHQRERRTTNADEA